MFQKACLSKFLAVIRAHNKYVAIAFALALLTVIPTAAGQSRKDLEEKRKSLLKEINRTGEELISAQKNKKAIKLSINFNKFYFYLLSELRHDRSNGINVCCYYIGVSN